MAFAPVVLVTATTESHDGRSRVVVDEPYTHALVGAGLIPLVLPPMDPALAVASLASVAGLVLTGGEDIDPRLFGANPHPATGEPHRSRDVCEIALVRAACERRIPTLALCRGAQIVNIAFGGTLIQDIPAAHPSGSERVHAVEIDPASRLASIVGSCAITVNSSHHQAIGNLGTGLRLVGRSPDDIIEAVESTDPAWWMEGLQWHPEELTDSREEWDRRIFDAFACEVRRGRRC